MGDQGGYCCSDSRNERLWVVELDAEAKRLRLHDHPSTKERKLAELAKPREINPRAKQATVRSTERRVTARCT